MIISLLITSGLIKLSLVSRPQLGSAAALLKKYAQIGIAALPPSPFLLLKRIKRSSQPTQPPARYCGVYPINQASLLLLVVPVFPATCNPPGIPYPQIPAPVPLVNTPCIILITE